MNENKKKETDLKRAAEILKQRLNIDTNNEQLEPSQISQIINLVKIYGTFLLQIIQLFVYKLFTFLVLLIKGEKSVDGEVVLITGSAGYLGTN